MCAEDSLVFSGYACDVWAAGICLHAFATGRLPFYSDVPMVLFDAIAAANLRFCGADLSAELRDVLGRALARDPAARAGMGELLRHPFCHDARTQRLEELGEVLEEAETLEEDDSAPPSPSQQPRRASKGSLRRLFATTKKRSRHKNESDKRGIVTLPSMLARSVPRFFTQKGKDTRHQPRGQSGIPCSPAIGVSEIHGPIERLHAGN